MARLKKWNPERKRQQILDAAIWILSRKLYYQCPISEIAKRARVAKGTVYLYFSSKEELYFSIVFMLMDKMKEFVESMTEDKILPSKRLFILLEKQSVFMEKNQNIFLAIRQNVKSHKEKYLNMLDKKLGEFVGTITNIINDGIKQGEFKNYPASSVALLFLSLMFANMHRKMDIHNKMVDVYVSPKLLWDIFSKGISK